MGERVARVYDVGDLVDVPVFEPEVLMSPWDLPATPPTSIAVPASRLGRGLLDERKRSIYQPPIATEKQRIDQLVALIQAGVDRSSWKAGKASAVGVGRRIVVVQSRQNQTLVAGLLEDMRASPPKHVSVEAVWARLDSTELARMLVPGDGAARIVDLAAIEHVPGAIAYRGGVTTVNGQWVRVRCGRARTVLDASEVVFGNTSAAFQPETVQLLDGAAVDVRPSLAPDGTTALLDLRSEVTRWDAPDEPPIKVPAPGNAEAPSPPDLKLDRLNLGVQSISTSLRGPTGTAILVGGTTQEERNEGDGRQLYLILRVTGLNGC
jgi:hypothetical protein